MDHDASNEVRLMLKADPLTFTPLHFTLNVRIVMSKIQNDWFVFSN